MRIAEIIVHDGRRVVVWLPSPKQRAHGMAAIALGPEHRIHRDNLTAEQAIELGKALILAGETLLKRREEEP